MAKLDEVGPLEVWAIVDAAQRWWRSPWTDRYLGLVIVGLLREEPG